MLLKSWNFFPPVNNIKLKNDAALRKLSKLAQSVSCLINDYVFFK